MRKIYFLVLLGLIQCLGLESFGQENLPNLSDSTKFQEFVIKQKEIQGLSIRFLLQKNLISDSIPADSILKFTELTPGVLTSESITQLDLLPKLLDTLKIFNPSWEFLVLTQPTTFNATQEYVANLLRNRDIQIVGSESGSGKDLVLLASNFQYVPFFKYKLPFITDFKLLLVSVIIIFFLVSAISMILFMLVFKAKRNREEQLKKDYEPIIADAISSLLFEKDLEELNQMSDVEIQLIFPEGFLSKSLFQSVLIEKIIGLNKKMKGDFKLKLKALYKRFGLDKLTISDLNSKRWDKVASALGQLNEMDLFEWAPEVKKFTNSPNFHVRTQAVGAFLNLSEKMDLTFLKDQTYPLSSWQEMNYLRIIKSLYKNNKELQMSSLFESENQSVRLFGYKLVRFIGKVDMLGNLETLAPNASDEEKIEIIKTYEFIGAHMQADFVNDCLVTENKKLQNVAAHALGVIGNENSINILENLLKIKLDLKSKMIFLRSLQNLDADRFEKFTRNQIDPDMKRIKIHLLDPLLNNV